VTLQVFAAASLTEVFDEIAQDFEAANPGTNVEFNFAGSSDLATQITEGAPADVFASANEKQMDAVGDAVTDPQLFATNTLTIVVPQDNPAGITGLQDLTNAGVKLVICAPEVPCGAATVTLEENEGVTLAPVSEESNVTDVLGKVASGEADAGIVYVTDIARAAGVKSVDLQGAAKVVSAYPIGTLGASEHPDEAQAFVDWVLSDAGQATLAEYGFGAP
jgi:molybdate transport system substrate-binding protein